MKTKLLLSLPGLWLGLQLAAAQGNAFTYQGRLVNNGVAVNGSNDFKFTMFGQTNGGVAVAGPITNFNVGVSNSLFTTALDFGAVGDAFYASDRWLEIATRPAGGGGAFTSLNPRQPITPTPHALYANHAGVAAAAATLTGPVPTFSLVGGYPQTVFITNAANQLRGTFTGNGAGLTSLNGTNLQNQSITSDKFHYTVGPWFRNSAIVNAPIYTGLNGAPVGIGTTAPGQALQVGDETIRGSQGMIRLGSRTPSLLNVARSWDIGVPQTGDDVSGQGYSFVIRDANNLGANAPFIVRYDTHYVGIGTNNPQSGLHVAGTVTANALSVPGAVMANSVSASGPVSGGSLSVSGDASFRNMPGVKYSQSDGGAGTHYQNGQSITVDSITMYVPANGFVSISAFVHTVAPDDLHQDFKLAQGNSVLVSSTSASRFTQAYLSWVLPVSAGSLSLRTILFLNDGNGNFGANYYGHNLTAVFLPVQY